MYVYTYICIHICIRPEEVSKQSVPGPAGMDRGPHPSRHGDLWVHAALASSAPRRLETSPHPWVKSVEEKQLAGCLVACLLACLVDGLDCCLLALLALLAFCFALLCFALLSWLVGWLVAWLLACLLD